jgi:hypothetical protein
MAEADVVETPETPETPDTGSDRGGSPDTTQATSQRRTPDPKNLASERLRRENVALKKQMGDLEKRYQDLDVKTSSVTKFIDAVRGTDATPKAPSLEDAPDVLEDPQGYNRHMETVMQQRIQDGIHQGLQQYSKEQVAQNAMTERQRLNREATERFTNRPENEWLADPARRDEFAAFLRQSIYGTGPHGSLTEQDLERAEWAYRGPEKAAEAQAEGQRRTVRQLSQASRAQTPRGRASTPRLQDLSPQEIAGELAQLAAANGSDAAMSEYHKLPSKLRGQVLRYLPGSDR